MQEHLKRTERYERPGCSVHKFSPGPVGKVYKNTIFFLAFGSFSAELNLGHRPHCTKSFKINLIPYESIPPYSRQIASSSS